MHSDGQTDQRNSRRRVRGREPRSDNDAWASFQRQQKFGRVSSVPATPVASPNRMERGEPAEGQQTQQAGERSSSLQACPLQKFDPSSNFEKDKKHVKKKLEVLSFPKFDPRTKQNILRTRKTCLRDKRQSQ